MFGLASGLMDMAMSILIPTIVAVSGSRILLLLVDVMALYGVLSLVLL